MTPSINVSRLTNLFLELCRIDTPPLKEKPIADYVQTTLEGMGLECVRDDAHHATGGDSGNLIVTIHGDKTGVPIFLSAHFDTVEPNPNVQIIVEDGVIKTDGNSILGADDKAGVAAILETVQVLMDSNISHGDIQLLLSVSEEIGLRGAANMNHDLIKARMGYVLDTGPPVGAIIYSAPTHDIFDVDFRGRAAHAGFEPEKGVSAIQAAALAISRMNLGRIDEETTANVGVIQGGVATNVIPERVTLRAEARSRNKEKLAAQVEHMSAAFRSAAEELGASVDIRVMREYESYLLREDDPVIALARKAANSIGLQTVLRAGGGGSDANIYNRIGIPACVLGTGMRAVHTHSEHILIDDLVRSAQWALAICMTAAAESVG